MRCARGSATLNWVWVDQLVEYDFPPPEGERPEAVLLKECPDLVVAAIDAEPGDLARGEIEHDLGRPDASIDDRFGSTLVEHVVGSTDCLDVLLRHRLLRKPGGFEGVGPIQKPLVAKHSSLAKRDYEPVAYFNIYPAVSAGVL